LFIFNEDFLDLHYSEEVEEILF